MTYKANNRVVVNAQGEGFFSNVIVTTLNGYATSAFTFQGSNFGYISGGVISPSAGVNTIERFPFATDTNSSDSSDLTVARGAVAGQSSSTHGYTSGGLNPPSYFNTIDRFPFSTTANASDVGDLSQIRGYMAGQSSDTSGYNSGGAAIVPAVTTRSNVIDKFPFASNANATDVGDLTEPKDQPIGHSSSNHGYTSSGAILGSGTNVIERFPFAVDSNSSDVGDLPSRRQTSLSGHSSDTSGYNSGGYITPPVNQYVNAISKFSFSTSSNGVDIGNLSVLRYQSVGGQSSLTSGYSAGGQLIPPFAYSNIIDKFPFSTDSGATDVGDITQNRVQSAGQQN